MLATWKWPIFFLKNGEIAGGCWNFDPNGHFFENSILYTSKISSMKNYSAEYLIQRSYRNPCFDKGTEQRDFL